MGLKPNEIPPAMRARMIEAKPVKAAASTAGPLAVALPWPPSVNTYYRNVIFRGRPKTLISKRGREYRSRVMSILQGQQPREGQLSVRVTMFPPDCRRRDIDNHTKALLDAMQHAGIYHDDAQIDRLELVRGEVGRGEVEVMVETIRELA